LASAKVVEMTDVYAEFFRLLCGKQVYYRRVHLSVEVYAKMLCPKCRLQMKLGPNRGMGTEFVCPSCGYKTLGPKEIENAPAPPHFEPGVKSSASYLDELESSAETPEVSGSPVEKSAPLKVVPEEPEPEPVATPPAKAKKPKKPVKAPPPLADWRIDLKQLASELDNVEEIVTQEIDRMRTRLQELEEKISKEE
jgi:hypothetical protein